nr:hypothetical protein [Tanacetum cinerariifolium]
MVTLGQSNAVVRRVVDHLVKLSGETTVPKHMHFFIAQQIVDTHHFIKHMRDEAQRVRDYIGQLNALIAEMKAIEDQGEVYDSLMCLRDDRRDENNKLMGLNELIAEVEELIAMKESHLERMDDASNSG